VKYPKERVVKLKEEIENSERRRFIRKLTSITALAGIGGLIFGHLTDRSLVPLVQAANGDPLKIGQANTGTLETSLTSSVSNSNAFRADNISTSGQSIGVLGRSMSTKGIGVCGQAKATTGNNWGVWGISQSSSGAGVSGLGVTGVYGWTISDSGVGVEGRAAAAGGIGVKAVNQATNGVALQCQGHALPSSDNAYNCGDNSKRWKLVRAKTVTSGDLAFENDYRFTEDKHSGLLLLNQKGERIARFDEQGNLHIKGDIIKDL